MARRFMLLIVLLLAAASASGAARAPGDPTLTIDGLDAVTRGGFTFYTVQVTGLTAAPEAGTFVVLTMPRNVWTVSSPEDEGDSGRCAFADGIDSRIVHCTVTKPATTLTWRVQVSFGLTLTPGDDVTIGASFGDLTAAKTVTVTAGADLGITKLIGPKLPLIAGRPFRYTVVVHNYGPDAVGGFGLDHRMDGDWYGGFGAVVNGPGQCYADPGSWICSIGRRLEVGGETRVEFEMQSGAGPGVWGEKGEILPMVSDNPSEGHNTGNNSAGIIPLSFAPKPGSVTTPTTPDGGETGGNGGEGGGLPITGTPTLALAAAGVLLLLAGAGALVLTRRRTTRL